VNVRAAFGDLAPGTRVVVGCSGGADSLALLVLACEHGLDVDAVYVDHGLRRGTEHEAATVAAAAERFGARFEVAPTEVGGGPNLEARARSIRYEALERIRVRVGAGAILVGHTRDDQAETVLLQMLRGAGLPGLAGMAHGRGAIVRPLLGVRRASTRELCARLGLVPVHDPMNDELQHRRVWLRREIIPGLERGADRDLVEVLARQADVLRDDDAVLDELAAAHTPDEAATLRALPAAVARRVVRRWLASPAPPSVATIERVLAVARGDARAAELPGGDRVERVHGRLARSAASTRADVQPPPPVTLVLPGRARFGDTEIEAWIEHAPPAAWPDGRMLVVCDADRVPERVVVRGGATGERFRPLGRSGSKLVRDAQAEAGVAPGRRSFAPVVVASEPVWVVGYRIDHRVRVTTDTRRYLWLSAESAAT
jgi:tRNA(Ile)-lysidine synthase